MRDEQRREEGRRDPVEVLLRRIAYKALGSTLLSGGVLAAGCTGADGSPGGGQEQEVSKFLEKPVATPDVNAATAATRDAGVRSDPSGPREPPQGGGSCATDSGTEPVPSDEFDPCARGDGFPVEASGLTLGEAYDYVAVRQVSASVKGVPPDAGATETWTVDNFELISETGKACATATIPTCAEKITKHAAPFFPSYCVQACVEWSVVTTHGDEVERWAEPNELLSLLGTIDSFDDALMVVASRGYDVVCGASNLLAPEEAHRRSVRAVPGGYEVLATRYADTCPVIVRRYRLFVSASGEVRELGMMDFPASNVYIGRIPAGLQTRGVARARSVLGDHLAQCAHLEAASVHAFLRLAMELRTHGAPAELVQRALTAARDEVRHARAIGALARARGGELSEPIVHSLPARTLEEIARENAVEGCVRETYGALVGAHQGERAADLPLRRAMRSIAEDEARHAALSYDVHAWLMGRLDAEARARVRAAQLTSIAELRAECEREPHPTLRSRAGLPSSELAGALLAELARELWSVELASAA